MNLLLTTGGTREPIDAVRYLGNRSSGRMGAAICAAGRAAGHRVTALVAPCQVRPEADEAHDVESVADLRAALAEHFPRCDVLVMAEAVSDYTPVVVGAGKLRRGGTMTLELEATPDLVAECGAAKRGDQRVVAFSLDEPTDAALQRAGGKLRRKNVDLLVYNPLVTMGGGDVTATILRPGVGPEPWPTMDKRAFADRLIATLA